MTNYGTEQLGGCVRRNIKPPAVPVSLLEEVLVLDERDAIRLEVGLLQAAGLAVLRSIATVPLINSDWVTEDITTHESGRS